MWVLAVYDCPMKTPSARRAYTIFRRNLLAENFMQLQKSLYVRNYPSMAAAEAVIARVKGSIPEDAAVAFFLVTDKQYGLTREFFGRRRDKKRPEKPLQVELFT